MHEDARRSRSRVSTASPPAPRWPSSARCSSSRAGRGRQGEGRRPEGKAGRSPSWTRPRSSTTAASTRSRWPRPRKRQGASISRSRRSSRRLAPGTAIARSPGSRFLRPPSRVRLEISANMAIDDRPTAIPFRDIEAKWQRVWEERKQFQVDRGPVPPEVLLPRDVPVSLRPHPHGPRPRLRHRRSPRPLQVDARVQRAPPDGLGRLRPARRERRHRARRPSRDVDLREHRRTCASQLRRMGISYDWDREVATCDPAYYRWEQLIFIRMLERGLAYRKRSTVNWCPSCQTVLANEQVEDGRCWRCDSEVEPTRDRRAGSSRSPTTPRSCSAWCDRLPGWPERVLTMQRNWIGRSEGAEFDLPVAGRPDAEDPHLHHAARHRRSA